MTRGPPRVRVNWPNEASLMVRPAESGSRNVTVLKALKNSPRSSSDSNFTGIGEATGTFLLCKRLAGKRSDVLLKKSTAVSWEDIGSHNVIFLGSPKFNVQLEDMPFDQAFVIEGGALKNLKPQAGEPAEFAEVWTPSHSTILEDHALITRLRGLHGRGEITILAASSTEGTWAATEYVTSPEYARELVSRLRLPSGKLPQAYQVVIRAKFKDQVPVDASYVTHRELAN